MSQNVIVLVIYLGVMGAMGLFFAMRNKSTDHYFLGSRKIPGWAIGLSMMGTSISSLTFLALPAAAFALDWRQLVNNLMLPALAALAIVFFIPIFRAKPRTSAFEYLEDRFGSVARVYGAISFIILQLLRVGMILALASIPVGYLFDVDIKTVIIFGGLFIMLYTVFGGIEAVIWTDVIQAIVLILGGILCFGLIIYDLPGGFGQVLEVGREHNKFSMGDMGWNLSLHERTFTTMILTGLFGWVQEYTSNQNAVQRFLAAKSTREARKATLICAVMSVPTWAFFFLVGTCLFVYFNVFPEPEVTALAEASRNDEVMPFFILNRVPAGLAGLIIAGVLAAAMSSLDSSLNAIATVGVVDILKRYALPGRKDKVYLLWARGIATVAGVIMIAIALYLDNFGKESMQDINLFVAAVFGGVVPGMFLLGFFTRFVNNTAMLCAFVATLPVNAYLVFNSVGVMPERWSVDIHGYWVGLLVNLLFVLLACFASLFIGRRNLDDEGLTAWTMTKEAEYVLND